MDQLTNQGQNIDIPAHTEVNASTSTALAPPIVRTIEIFDHNMNVVTICLPPPQLFRVLMRLSKRIQNPLVS